MVNHAIAPDRPAGLAGTREFLATMGRHQMTHEGWRELVVVADGDYIVQYGVRHGRWHGGRFMGFDAAPGDYSRGFAAMYRFETGRSLNVGRCETTSPCFDNSAPCRLRDRERSGQANVPSSGQFGRTSSPAAPPIITATGLASTAGITPARRPTAFWFRRVRSNGRRAFPAGPCAVPCPRVGASDRRRTHSKRGSRRRPLPVGRIHQLCVKADRCRSASP